MCTVSLITVPARGLRLVINRDESSQRPGAVPPAWRGVADGVRAIWPTDPQGGGTWVAASDAGLIFALLNQNLAPPPALPEGLLTRGGIIPALAHAASITHAVRVLGDLPFDRFAPFRLLMASTREDHCPRAAVASWDRTRLSIDDHASIPLCLASSGLGDGLVQRRLPLFREVAGGSPTAEMQDAFHAHQWPGEEHLSVLMLRPGYRTVSVTTVEVDDNGVRMHYRPIP